LMTLGEVAKGPRGNFAGRRRAPAFFKRMRSSRQFPLGPVLPPRDCLPWYGLSMFQLTPRRDHFIHLAAESGIVPEPAATPCGSPSSKRVKSWQARPTAQQPGSPHLIRWAVPTNASNLDQMRHDACLFHRFPIGAPPPSADDITLPHEFIHVLPHFPRQCLACKSHQPWFLYRTGTRRVPLLLCDGVFIA
jgi:hypothetical protein